MTGRVIAQLFCWIWNTKEMSRFMVVLGLCRCLDGVSGIVGCDKVLVSHPRTDTWVDLLKICVSNRYSKVYVVKCNVSYSDWSKAAKFPSWMWHLEA
jgi:hypothetical protein